MQRARLEEWSVVTRAYDPYTAPEARASVLQGKVYGHPKLQDGGSVTTSLIVELDLNNRKATTNNTIYDLGAPKADYRAAFAGVFTMAGWDTVEREEEAA